MSSKSDKEKNLFKKLTALPYLLVLLALLMPLANVSCSAKDDSKPIAQMTLYQIAAGVNLGDAIESSALKQMNRMVKENPKVLDHFKTQMPNFPKMEPVHHLYGIIAAVIFLFTFFGIRSLHLFVKSVYKSIESGTFEIQKRNATAAWLIVYAVFAGIGAIGGIINIIGLIGSVTMCVTYILLSILVNRYYKDM